MSASVDSHALRAIIIKLQDYLTDDDRQRLHFFLGSDVPKSIRDNPSLTGTLELVESLFQQDKINEQDFTFLIDAFDEIRCFDAVKILREYRREMQDNGQFESIRSLTSILLQDLDEDKIARENITCSLTMNNQRNNYGNNNVLMDNKTTNINPMNIFVEKPSSKLNKKYPMKALLIRKKFYSMLKLLLIVGLSVVMGICITKINTLNEELRKRDQIIVDKGKIITKYDEPKEHLIEVESLCEKKSRPLDFYTKLHNVRNRNGITVAGRKGSGGDGLDQLRNPLGFYVDGNETIYIADQDNHRIIAWKKDATTGEIVAGGNGQGSQNNTLHSPTSVLIDSNTDSFIIADHGNQRIVRWPRHNSTISETIISNSNCIGLAMDHEGYLYVSEPRYGRIRRWRIGESSEGTAVPGENGHGYGLDQFYYPNYIFIDEDGSLYVSEAGNHRVMKIIKKAKQGIVIAGGHGSGNGLENLNSPHGILVDRSGTLYIADTNNDRIVRWLKDAKEGELVVGVSGSNQLNKPKYLTFDRQNNLYVLDSGNNRVQKFFAFDLK